MWAIPSQLKIDINEVLYDSSYFLMDGVLYRGDLAAATETLKRIAFVADVGLKTEGQRFVYTLKLAPGPGQAGPAKKTDPLPRAEKQK